MCGCFVKSELVWASFRVLFGNFLWSFLDWTWTSQRTFDNIQKCTLWYAKLVCASPDILFILLIANRMTACLTEIDHRPAYLLHSFLAELMPLMTCCLHYINYNVIETWLLAWQRLIITQLACLRKRGGRREEEQVQRKNGNPGCSNPHIFLLNGQIFNLLENWCLDSVWFWQPESIPSSEIFQNGDCILKMKVNDLR